MSSFALVKSPSRSILKKWNAVPTLLMQQLTLVGPALSITSWLLRNLYLLPHATLVTHDTMLKIS